MLTFVPTRSWSLILTLNYQLTSRLPPDAPKSSGTPPIRNGTKRSLYWWRRVPRSISLCWTTIISARTPRWARRNSTCRDCWPASTGPAIIWRWRWIWPAANRAIPPRRRESWFASWTGQWRIELLWNESKLFFWIGWNCGTSMGPPAPAPDRWRWTAVIVCQIGRCKTVLGLKLGVRERGQVQGLRWNVTVAAAWLRRPVATMWYRLFRITVSNEVF